MAKAKSKHGIPVKFFRDGNCLARNVGELKALLAELPDDLPVEGDDLEDDDGRQPLGSEHTTRGEHDMGYRIHHDDGRSYSGITEESSGCVEATFYGPRHREHAEASLKLLESQSPSGPTVKCRIAVAMSRLGDWGAFGINSSDEDLVRRLREYGLLESSDRVSFIEADVPLPQRVEPAVIEGKVVSNG